MSAGEASGDRPPGGDGDGPAILIERAAWLVVDKPAGWHTVEAAGAAPHDDAAESSDAAGSPVDDPAAARGSTVEAWLRRERPELAALPEAGLVHRLDLHTSGCLLVARSAVAQRALRDALSDPDGGIRKIYLAVVVAGIPARGSFTLHFRGRHRRSAKVSVSHRGEARERGRCRWRRLDVGGGGADDGARGTAARTESTTGPASARGSGGDLVEVELIGPGRRHQIRAGLARLGFPLLGDALYHGPAPLPGLAGPALHAWRLHLDGETVEAPLRGAWAQFQSRISRRTDGVSSTRPTHAG